MTNDELTIMNLPSPPKWEIITPELAKVYLSFNASNNRFLNRSVVNKYKADIASGNWMATHQGIAFDNNGLLIDGQHRLTAIAESGVSVPMLVTRGIDKPGLLVIDSGKVRTASDSLKVSGYDPVIRSRNAHAFIKQLNVLQFGVSSAKVWSNEELLEDVTELYNLCSFAVKRARDMKNRSKVSAPELVAVFSAVASGVDARAVKTFFYCAYDAKLDAGDYNWQAALVHSREAEKLLYRSGSGRNGFDRFELTERAIYKFVNNTSRIPKKVTSPIFKAEKEQFIWLNDNFNEIWGG